MRKSQWSVKMLERANFLYLFYSLLALSIQWFANQSPDRNSLLQMLGKTVSSSSLGPPAD